MIDLDRRWDVNKRQDETALLEALVARADLDAAARARITARAAKLVRGIRSASRPGLMDVFLAEYGLSTDEGVALMCLAEALLRVPDGTTMDALIEDKIAPSDWSRHIGQSTSPLVNASTWGLMLTGRVLDDEPQPGLAGRLRGMVRRLGEPVIRKAVGGAMREMGRQFVLGQDIKAAMARAAKMEARGYTYSYDMLGEAAMTAADAARYAEAYARAIDAISAACTSDEIAANPGISVKLSALHPRYLATHRDQVLAELVPDLVKLAQMAKAHDLNFTVDAEEVDRLELSLDVIDRAFADPSLAGWDGFGLAIQAYQKRAPQVIDHIAGLCRKHGRRNTNAPTRTGVRCVRRGRAPLSNPPRRDHRSPVEPPLLEPQRLRARALAERDRRDSCTRAARGARRERGARAHHDRRGRDADAHGRRRRHRSHRRRGASFSRDHRRVVET